jgi:hypothetical protein
MSVVKCKDCKWWTDKSYEEPTYRRCSHPMADRGDDPGGFGSVDGEPFNGGCFASGPEFGCIYGERPEVKP